VSESPSTDRNVRGIVFDLDGTMYPLGRLRLYVMLALSPWLGRLRRYTALRAELAGEDFGSGEALWAETLARLARDPAEQAAWGSWIRARYDRVVAQGMRTVARARPGLPAALTRLQASGVQLAVVSDYRGVDERLRELGLDPEVFALRLETEALGAMKPAPRIASLTEERLGIPGPQLLVVGDRAFTDQRFADALGARFLGVADRQPAKPGFFAWPEVLARIFAAAGVEPGSSR
jgi:phosphoglycolate phosphatase-like HAD superfamily hydrolase